MPIEKLENVEGYTDTDIYTMTISFFSYPPSSIIAFCVTTVHRVMYHDCVHGDVPLWPGTALLFASGRALLEA